MYVCEVAAAVVVAAVVVEEDVFPIAMAEAPKAVGGTNQNIESGRLTFLQMSLLILSPWFYN